ncbi:unnamed protein product [Heligmosomoides polygyrus]|uniref:Reverse transcriptase domain-containing protein n=1 Tax=Heligmosomoides polygyrus TaxID=6339 RepID=A0A183F717_HELPZ|nr:unnamed protein product [Heligmosomoides polygyrus]
MPSLYEADRSIARVQAAAVSYVHRPEEGIRLCRNWSGRRSPAHSGGSYSVHQILRELYSGFTTKISPFYNDFIIDVKRGVRQGDTISPKLFSANLEMSCAN